MKRLHLICNAHLDPIWQWEWEEGAAAALSTFQSAANLAEKYDYIFCHNEVNLYKYTERYAPALFAQIQKLVKQGKWHIMGGWYLQPDCLMPSGEGMVRQIREGELYFKEKFGVMPTTAVNFDPFGHSRGLVQILSKCGQDSYMFMRPYGKHMPYPQLDLPSECFVWEGYDGSKVKGVRVTEYNSPLGHAREKVESDISRRKEEEVSVSPWGVGNHGGGPSAKDLEDVQKLIETSDIEIKYSTPEGFFADVNPTEVFAESIIPCMVGCYTSMAGLKQKYRELERQLYFTEKIASIASLKGAMEYPTEVFEEVTEDMLNVQFHDILPGDMIKAGEDNGFTYINHGLHLLNQVRANAFFALCKGQKVAEPDTYPIMVFNPKTYGGKQLVTCDLSIIPTDYYEEELSYLEIYDEDGNLLSSQNVKESSNISIDWRKRVVFEADLKPLSISRFTAKTVVRKKPVYESNKDIVFDNGEKKVVISAKTGLIESYVVDGKEYAKGKLFAPYMYQDSPDPWGMNQPWVGDDPEAFELLANPDGVFEGLKSFEIIEDGDMYLEAEAFFGKGLTRLRIGYKIYKKGTKVDVNVTLFPNEANKAIKLHVPVAGKDYSGEQMFGAEKLFEDGRECIAHDYVWLNEENGKCLQIITPSTYGSSYKDGEIRLTLVKTATYCAHPVPNRPLLREGIFIGKVDQGQRDFSFRLDVVEKNTLKHNANEFVELPYALNIFPTIDTKCDNGLTIECSNERISTETIRKSVQKDGYIFRLFNNSEDSECATINCGGATIDVKFGKYEVKTLIYNNDTLVETEQMFI